MSTRWTYAVMAVLLAGCGADGTPGNLDSGGVDTGAIDTGAVDTGAVDTGVRPDVPVVDGGKGDTGAVDVGTVDAGDIDTGTTDAGTVDTGDNDTGTSDAGAPDTGTSDAGAPDTGTIDAGAPDAGTSDAGPRDVVGDASDAAVPVDVQSAGCALPLGTITLPGAVDPISGITRGTSTIPSASCSSSASGPENVYRLTITATTGVILDTDNAATTFDTVLSIRRTCGDLATDVACDDDSGNTPANSSIVRTALSPGSYSVIVDGYSGGAGNYVLRARTFDVAANAVCPGAAALTAASPLAAQDVARAGSANTACVTGGGGQLFYSFTLPANSQATLRATPTGTAPAWTPVLRALNDCSATTCAGNATGGVGTVATLALANTTAAPRTFTLAVSPTSSAITTGTFDLSAAVTTVVPSSNCDAPVAVVNGSTATTGDTTIGTARASRCSTADLGNEVFYRVSVPAGQRVSVRAQPQSGGTWRARLRAVAGCSATTCLSSAVATTDGGEALLNLDNPSQLNRTLVVSVTSTTALGGPFSLVATAAPLSPAPTPYYVLSSIGAACDDVAAGTAVAPSGGWSDDSTSAIAALPFPVRFFAADATHFSVASNGFAQLWPSATGSPNSDASNPLIPATGTPNNFIAPFWDDLVPVNATTSLVRALTVGAAPSRRFVLEWTSWQPYNGGATDRLTFQAKLFETTGVIEFHYCSIDPVNDRTTGSSATVGVEDAAGARGNLVGYNFPGAFFTGSALRLTPPAAP